MPLSCPDFIDPFRRKRGHSASKAPRVLARCCNRRRYSRPDCGPLSCRVPARSAEMRQNGGFGWSKNNGLSMRQTRSSWLKTALALMAAAAMVGCAASTDVLARTPNRYAGGNNCRAADGPARDQTVSPTVLFVTDRSQRRNSDGSNTYLASRSDSMAYGTATVAFEGVASWTDLVTLTQSGMATRPPRLVVTEFKDEIRFSKTPIPDERRDGRVRLIEADAAEYGLYQDQARARIGAQMRASGTSSILVYVHGFNNDFDDALTKLTNIWHFAGRRSVQMAFSWPAGNSGPFGYFRDRESGDVSVYHLKETLDLLASVPEIDQIDIIAHSRGTNVATSVLRELVIRANGRDVGHGAGVAHPRVSRRHPAPA